MTEMSISDSLSLAVRHLQEGRLAETEKICRSILQISSTAHQAYSLLGAVANYSGKNEQAAAFFEQAIAIQPQVSENHHNLAIVLIGLGRFDEAEDVARRALSIDPGNLVAENDLGNALRNRGRLQEAEAAYQRVLAAQPNFAEAENNLGMTLKAQDRLEEATQAYRRALMIQPSCAKFEYNLGIVLQSQDHLEEAAEAYQRALSIQPSLAEAANNLGNTFRNQDRLEEAIEAYRRALAIRPTFAEVQTNLGNVLQVAGRLREAVEAYRQVLVLKPSDAGAKDDLARAEYNLGIELQNEDRLEEAEETYRRALEIKPNYPKAENNLGNTLKDLDRPEEALGAYRRALALQSNFPEAEFNLGNLFLKQERWEEAIEAYERALAIRPNFAEVEDNLGTALKSLGRYQDAEQAHRRAIVIDPHCANAMNNLGHVLCALDRMKEAEASFRQAIDVKPDYAGAENNLGFVLQAQGRLKEAVRAYQKALDLEPDYAEAHSNFAFIQNFFPGVTLASLASEHAEWDRRHAAPLKSSWRLFGNIPDPDRTLRFGFVSPDFGNHPVSFFFVRCLESFEPGEVETVCYSDRMDKDEFTNRLMAAAGTWRETRSSSDEALADRIREDGIDILFDLAGHTANNRLLVFARKPAPIQVAWIGYMGTTGLSAIDYLVADRYLVPKESEIHYQESIIRLPDGYMCYDPPGDAPRVGPLPAISNGYVTFGSFNQLAKISGEVIELWAKILRKVPQSRLVLKHKGLADSGVRGHFEELLVSKGVDSNRVELLGWIATGAISLYNRIDINLDPFPYTGSTTTCDALWMGVPVVTYPGETFASRQSFTHLSNLGLTETIAKDFDEYVEIAVDLAKDYSRLAELRAGLRKRMANSPICDGKRFANNFTEAMRNIWREWCRNPSPGDR